MPHDAKTNAGNFGMLHAKKKEDRLRTENAEHTDTAQPALLTQNLELWPAAIDDTLSLSEGNNKLRAQKYEA